MGQVIKTAHSDSESDSATAQGAVSELKEYFKERIINEFLVGKNIVPNNACWIDHSPCPYDFPKGQFNLRPGVYCVNCRKVDENLVDEIDKLADPDPDTMEHKKLSEIITERVTDMKNCDEAQILTSAASIIKAYGKIDISLINHEED